VCELTDFLTGVLECAGCGEEVIRNSREHDECFIIPSTQMLFCPDCRTEAEQGCPQCGATDGGPIEGCDDCGITRQHGQSWWSEDPPSAEDPQEVPAEDPILRLLGLNTPAERSLSRSSSSSTGHPAGTPVCIGCDSDVSLCLHFQCRHCFLNVCHECAFVDAQGVAECPDCTEWEEVYSDQSGQTTNIAMLGTVRRLVMAGGGADAWNYVLADYAGRVGVYIERHPDYIPRLQRGMRLVFLVQHCTTYARMEEEDPRQEDEDVDSSSSYERDGFVVSDREEDTQETEEEENEAEETQTDESSQENTQDIVPQEPEGITHFDLFMMHLLICSDDDCC
jgi:hypothetical protein